MTQKLANEVKDLASPCNEAIKAIAGERECPTCAGKGREPVIGDYALRQTSQKCKRCNGTGKVKYVWEPERGEYYLIGMHDEPKFLSAICKKEGNVWLYYLYWDVLGKCYSIGSTLLRPQLIPILPWETIERILKGVGYSLEFTDKGIIENCGAFICDRKNRTKTIFSAEAKTRQEAVMLAVIKLGKEI